MKSLYTFAAACALLCLLLVSCQCSPKSTQKAERPELPSGPQQVQLPAQGVYGGAYIDFGEAEDTVTLEALESFEGMVGKQMAIIASSSYWGRQSFPTKNMEIIARHGGMPLVFWSPWDEPYDQDKPEKKFTLTSILEGKWDAYIDAWGDSAKAFGRPLFVAWGIEMNGTWFPWSGWFYGKNQKTAGETGFAGSDTYRKAYRYVVDRVRARGASNILWVFHANSYSYPQDTWNFIRSYYPGRDYVDWLALSVYGKQFKKDPWVNFEGMVKPCYQDICSIDPTLPVMLAEWGVGEFSESGNKAEFIRDALQIIPKLPRVKAAVFWHERWENEDGSFSNLRVNSSPEALDAFRTNFAGPEWLERVRFAPHPPKVE